MGVSRILVADDQPDVLAALKLLLKGEGYQTKTADSPSAVLETLAREQFDLLLIDLNYTRDTTSGREGLDLLARIHRLPQPPPVLVMTAWGSLETAVEAMRHGARDFVLKPWDNEKLLESIRAQLEEKTSNQDPSPAKQEELEIARQVQAKLFPQKTLPTNTLDYGGRCVQAGVVGGDYYDFLNLGTGRIGLVLADISGKGMGAAILMSNLQAALRSLAWQVPQNPGVLLRTLNLQFRETTEAHHFATMFLGDYEDSSRRLRYANCGHNPPLVLRRNGKAEWLDSTAPVLGVLEAFYPTVAEVTLEPGDLLVIYSDGVTDSVDAEGREFRDLGLLQWLQTHPGLEPTALIDGLAKHCLSSSQPDDFTLVVGRCR